MKRIAVVDSKIAVRPDGAPPKKVYLAPTGKALPFEIKEGHVCLDPCLKAFLSGKPFIPIKWSNLPERSADGGG